MKISNMPYENTTIYSLLRIRTSFILHLQMQWIPRNTGMNRRTLEITTVAWQTDSSAHIRLPVCTLAIDDVESTDIRVVNSPSICVSMLLDLYIYPPKRLQCVYAHPKRITRVHSKSTYRIWLYLSIVLESVLCGIPFNAIRARWTSTDIHIQFRNDLDGNIVYRSAMLREKQQDTSTMKCGSCNPDVYRIR